MPSPLEAILAAHLRASGNSKPSPTVQQGDAAMLLKARQEQMQKMKEQQVVQQFTSGLEQRLNPRIGTKDDTDPMVQLMMRMRGMTGMPAMPQGVQQ
jgi:hypothetical protein